MRAAESIPGWTRGDEALELARVCFSLPRGACIVEIGSFLGGATVLLAGARRLRGSGVVHCVDPFDGTGDAFSVPFYRDILGGDARSPREIFDGNIERAGLPDWVEIHAGTVDSIGERWTRSIDLLFLDGDHSPRGARLAFERWVPFLQPGGVLALHNSSDRDYAEGHDGHRRLVVESVSRCSWPGSPENTSMSTRPGASRWPPQSIACASPTEPAVTPDPQAAILPCSINTPPFSSRPDSGSTSRALNNAVLLLLRSVVEAAIVKDVGTIWEQRLPARARELAAFVEESAANRSTFEEQLAYATLIAPKLTIQGGTTEILRGIIARGLGLR